MSSKVLSNRKKTYNSKLIFFLFFLVFLGDQTKQRRFGPIKEITSPSQREVLSDQNSIKRKAGAVGTYNIPRRPRKRHPNTDARETHEEEAKSRGKRKGVEVNKKESQAAAFMGSCASVREWLCHAEVGDQVKPIIIFAFPGDEPLGFWFNR